MIQDSFLKSFRETKSPFIMNPYRFAAAGGGAVGGWKELARTTLGSAGDNISVGSLADKRYLMFLTYNTATGGDAQQRVRLNSDTGSNYARRNDWDGGGDGTAASQPFMSQNNGALSTPTFSVGYFANKSDKEKLMISHSIGQNTAGSGTAPNRAESVGKWANTSAAISEVTMYNSEAGSFDTGSECVVLGWDPADTDTSGFWEELGSVELGSAGDTIDSGTITAKKYLWIQGYCKNTGGDIRPTFQFNSDTGSNYANRQSKDGGADSSNTGVDRMYLSDTANQGVPVFFNIFVVNNSANEKLCIAHIIDQGTAGAGNAPNRQESVGKWANTSSQITSIQVQNDRAGDFNTGSILKVWGSN